MKHVLWLKADGGRFRLEMLEGQVSLAQMQALVGGPIELWPTKVDYHGASLQLIVNEDARLIGLPPNKAATDLTRESCPGCVDVLGDAFLPLDADLDDVPKTRHYVPDPRD